MIIVTGAAGFIGSNLISRLNAEGVVDILAVDDFSNIEKNKNLANKIIGERLHRDSFSEWMTVNHQKAGFVFHIGARTDTAEFNKEVFDKLNLSYSKMVWEQCCRYRIPLIYASSAATYGLGELGYTDAHEIIPELKPLNPYGESKNEFDKWVLNQEKTPPYWYGFKFFNVYGPNEYHKGRMASVIFHAFNQVQATGKMKLFKSHNPGFKDGEQKRDFVYVKDVTDVLLHFMRNKIEPGIFNLGTGKARTFLDLVLAVFRAMKKADRIEFIDIPEDIREKYQYFTCAEMGKLRDTGYQKKFFELEDGIEDYVMNYLMSGSYN
ncbi:MAG: ADP-glyceromanno-heptose 6-epimerase [Bacteroidales bacterium]|nr:ADP-glyceromanno-heptose 6-epimerase [Bacteroidales bacterium]